ncbi:hypothetical protein QJQ45_011854 [Haematococcus lacustris]|nr:hypothetical protein QJQ45_011854 [Haematococcus lacustris]
MLTRQGRMSLPGQYAACPTSIYTSIRRGPAAGVRLRASTSTQPQPQAQLAHLLVSCPDAKGVVASLSQLLFGLGCNIISSDQYSDIENMMFFQRVAFDYSDLVIGHGNTPVLERAIGELARRFDMKWRIAYRTEKKRVAILVSRLDHCLYDLLIRHKSGELHCDIPIIMSNHTDLQSVAEMFNIPFRCLPLANKEDKAAQEAGIEEATSELDAGPIIDQHTTRITHRDSVADMVRSSPSSQPAAHYLSTNNSSDEGEEHQLCLQPSRKKPSAESDDESALEKVEEHAGSNGIKLSDSPLQHGLNGSTSGKEDSESSSSDHGSDTDDMDMDSMQQQHFCRNCTAGISGAHAECYSCQHAACDDELLVSASAQAQRRESSSQALHHCGVQPNQGIALLYDERMELHEEEDALSPHPERPDRLRAIMARLRTQGLTERCVDVKCVVASVAQLAAVHTLDLIRFVQCMSEEPPTGVLGAALSQDLTSDSYINAHTYHCARLAAGGAVQVAEMVADGRAAHGAAIIRPPGHHAESNVAMGFCFFNNAAVAARAAQAKGAQRVLILDWDVHHGNGTQHIFEDDSSVLYMSLHRYDNGHFYPGTGAASEVGRGAGVGFTVNVPWDAPGLTNGDYLTAFHALVLPIAYEFNPSLIIVSAGFDAADGDPVGGCRLTPEIFGHMTALLKPVAPLVLLLEGGYNLSATAASTEACLRVLLGEAPPCLPGPRHPSWVGRCGIQAAQAVQACYWRSVRALVHCPAAPLAPMGSVPRPAGLRPSLQPVIAAPVPLGTTSAPHPLLPVPQPPPSHGAEQWGVPQSAPGVSRVMVASADAVGITTSSELTTHALQHPSRLRQPRQTTAVVKKICRRRAEMLLRCIRKQALQALWQRHRRLAVKRS